MELRRRHPREQGDIGERAAVEWLWRAGASVFMPVGHSPDFDLIAAFDSYLYRIEVKTSTVLARNSRTRYEVQLATGGGNRSWDEIMKWFDPTRCEFVFVLVADGRRWLIPTAAITSRKTIMVGGPRCAAFEVVDHGASEFARRLLKWSPPPRGDTQAVKGDAL